jgi:hypothetical protein
VLTSLFTFSSLRESLQHCNYHPSNKQPIILFNFASLPQPATTSWLHLTRPSQSPQFLHHTCKHNQKHKIPNPRTRALPPIHFNSQPIINHPLPSSRPHQPPPSLIPISAVKTQARASS